MSILTKDKIERKKLERNNRAKVFKESIILNGPVGSGKTLISCALENATGMKVVHLDTMRFLHSADMYRFIIDNETDSFEIKKAKFLLSVRENFPKIKNFEDFGFDGNVARRYRNKFGDLGYRVYNKQFETMLLEEVLKKIKEPCIIDMGGTFGISLEEKYKSLLQILLKEEPDMVYENINFDYMGFEKIKMLLSNFVHVFELKLPEEYKNGFLKATNSQLNDAFIASGQYEATATNAISVEGLVSSVNGKDEINMNKLEQIVEEIKRICRADEIERV